MARSIFYTHQTSGGCADACVYDRTHQMDKTARSGISYISNRYSKAKNRYLKTNESKQESKHIIYLNANKLYGYAMSKFLPTSGFSWKDPKESDLNKYPSINSKGCNVFSKLKLNILKSYKNYTVIIF